jgi:hypothetical protein
MPIIEKSDHPPHHPEGDTQMRQLTAWFSVAMMSLMLFVGTLLFGASQAGATTCVAYPSGCTSAVTTIPTQAVTPLPAVAATPDGGGSVAAASSGTLPFTGADVAGTVVGGAVLIAVGTGLVVATRRRRSA